MLDLAAAQARFLAAAAHDLCQPAHAIRLSLEQLRGQCCNQADDMVAKAISTAEVAWQALNRMLSQILDLARLDAGSVTPMCKPVRLGELVHGVIMQFAMVADRAGVRLMLLGRESICAVADEMLLRRVISNLVDNAIAFSPPGSNVVVALRQSGASVRLQVRDAGVGIPASLHEAVFDAFVQAGQRADVTGRGTGLGLAIVRRMVELMNGTVTLRSQLRHGTSVTVRLAAVTPG